MTYVSNKIFNKSIQLITGRYFSVLDDFNEVKWDGVEFGAVEMDVLAREVAFDVGDRCVTSRQNFRKSAESIRCNG